jgi:hypothetical protein
MSRSPMMAVPSWGELHQLEHVSSQLGVRKQQPPVSDCVRQLQQGKSVDLVKTHRLLQVSPSWRRLAQRFPTWHHVRQAGIIHDTFIIFMKAPTYDNCEIAALCLHTIWN